MHKPLANFHEELNRLFVKGCEDHQNGQLDDARESYLKLLDYFADAPVLHYNLGLVYFAQGEYAAAVDAFAMASQLNPDDSDILYNLALSEKQNGMVEDAIQSYRRLLDAEPQSIDALYNLAGCYKDIRQFGESIDVYEKVIELDPCHESANSNLAYVYHLAGNTEKAIHHYRQVLNINPEHQAAKHMLDALSGIRSTSSPDSYVRDMFDNYSQHYEHSLVTDLEYCVPITLRKHLDICPEGQSTYRHGLDLGCGTGLSGEAFADMVESLDGIDLSTKMIAIAERKQIYNHLYCGSISDFLSVTNQSYDFFLAADVFAYIGDLSQTFALLRQKALAGAIFCFSTENLRDEDYRLQKTGRFAHSSAYIQRLACETGWAVQQSWSTSLRKEQGNWVTGDLWILKSVAADPGE